MNESGLISAHILLDFWQCKYVYYFFSLSNSMLIKNIFPVTLCIEDKNMQPEDLLKKTKFGQEID